MFNELCKTCARKTEVTWQRGCIKTHLFSNEHTVCEDYKKKEMTPEKESDAVILKLLAKELLECLNDEIKCHGDAAERTLETIDKAIDLLY